MPVAFDTLEPSPNDTWLVNLGKLLSEAISVENTMFDTHRELAIRVLTEIEKDPTLITTLIRHMGKIPNVPSTTIGDAMFWINIASTGGWKLQRNWYFGNCRIMDPSDIARVWGREEALLDAFQSLEAAPR